MQKTAQRLNKLTEREPYQPMEARQGLLDTMEHAIEGMSFPDCLKARYHEDKFFEQIIEDPKAFKNFEISDGLIYLKEEHRRVLCIPKTIIKGRSAREIVISHAHSVLAHLGAHKTLL
jgi:hypothetical protein